VTITIRDNLNGNNCLSKRLSKYYLLHNDILFIRKSDHSTSPWSIYTPKYLERILIIAFYDYYGHPGSVKTAHALRKHIYFGRFFRTVREVKVIINQRFIVISVMIKLYFFTYFVGHVRVPKL